MNSSAATPSASDSASLVARRYRTEAIMKKLLLLCGLTSIATSIGILVILAYESWAFFSEVSLLEFLTSTEWTPLFSQKHYGILPLLCGTLLTSVIAMCVAIPFGLLIAVFLSEYASSGTRKVIKPVLELLSGVPTIVYGYFALLVVTPLLQEIFPTLSGFNALSPGLVMGIMILPMVASLSEDALYSVPAILKEGAFAMGASKLQMVITVLIPAGFGGITAAIILAIARAVGETMIVAVAAGQQPVLSLNPMNSVETMTAYIVQVSLGDTPHGTLEYHTIFAVGAALFVLTLTLNMLSLWIRERFQLRYR